MKKQYPLFQSHLDLAHTLWKGIIQPGDLAIDATCGNGHDTFILSQLPLKKLYALDIQKEALEATAKLVNDKTFLSLHHQSHETFPKEIEDATVSLIIYNLGYLPGGDKTLTTQTNSTLKSIQEAKRLIRPGGAISITCYPGHEEGAYEEAALLQEVTGWDPKLWSCCHHRWLNRKKAPSLLLIQHALDS